MRSAGPAILLAGAAAVLGAAPAGADAGYDACMLCAATDADFRRCGAALVEREEARLEDAWRALIGRLPAEGRRALRAEQRAWTRFRKRSCRVYADRGYFGSYHRTIAFPLCRARVVADRAGQLRAIDDVMTMGR